MSQDFSTAIGRRDSSGGVIGHELVSRYHATFDQAPAPEAPLPLGLHWCLGLEARPTAELGPDGHPPKGEFLPAIPLPRRMWAAGNLTILRPLRQGQLIQRESEILDVSEKRGASGLLYFVTVGHRISADGALAIEETQDIVYREASSVAGGALPLDAPGPLAPEDRRLLPGPQLLFRYSALTFNTHRIHYDLDYARDQEGYPGLVVHGPMQAALLAEHAAHSLGRDLRQFSFRGRAPAFAGLHLTLRAEPTATGVKVWSEQNGAICMMGEAE